MDRQFARGAGAWQDAWLDEKVAAQARRRRIN
jgi:hypothetical protein